MVTGSNQSNSNRERVFRVHGAGYSVKNLGNNMASQANGDTVRKEQPQFLGRSALLTGTVGYG